MHGKAAGMGHRLPCHLAHATFQGGEADEAKGADNLAVALGAVGLHLAQQGHYCRTQHRERCRRNQRPTVGVVPRVKVSGLGLLDGAFLTSIVTLGACGRDGRQLAGSRSDEWPIRSRGVTCDDCDTSSMRSMLSGEDGVFMTSIVISGACGRDGRQSVGSRPDGRSVRAGGHLRQLRHGLDAHSSGHPSSLPTGDAPSAHAADCLHARSSGHQNDTMPRRMTYRASKGFCVGVWRDLWVILQIWGQSVCNIAKHESRGS